MTAGFFSNTKRNPVRRLKIHPTPVSTAEQVVIDKTPSPAVPTLEDLNQEFNFDEQREPPRSVLCKHCKKSILEDASEAHVAGCLKQKQEKARKKKEAREAAQRAKERAERGDDEDDEDEDVKDGKGRKVNGAKRKLEGEDDKDGNKKKKNKKDDSKPKAKPKGPVDVERQCGVTLPNGQQCARSLTCKSHSMGAKRAVPGRSLPYDMLLAAYQKKNQARQQKAAIDASVPTYDDEFDVGPIDSDEERDAVMNSISRCLHHPQPLVTHTLYPTKRKYQLVRMKEVLSNALSGNRGAGLFSVQSQAGVDGGFALPSAASHVTMAQPTVKRGPSVDVGS